MSDSKDAKAEAKAAKAKAKALRPWFRKKRFWAIGLLGVIIVVNLASQGDSNVETQSNATETEQVDDSQDTSSNTEAEVSNSNETAGQENARESAESYLKFQAFSRTGLIKQLEFEDYSTEDATYAVDAVNADWNEQAAKSAKSYLDYSSFSRSGLIDQLLFEGFTQSQAEYGVSTTGL